MPLSAWHDRPKHGLRRRCDDQQQARREVLVDGGGVRLVLDAYVVQLARPLLHCRRHAQRLEEQLARAS